MIQYQRHILANGLSVLLHCDESTPLVTVCMSYHVGSRDESPNRTGFAHLFEHLMFGGTEAVPHYDEPIQKAGGENNAFTNQDMTVYYNVVPAANVELILYLEADRLGKLKLNPKALDTQRKVVIEEFKETCLNQPYGDAWHLLGELTFQKHPYRVPTIGLDPSHIADASLEEVQAFFERFYSPNNAVLSISGPINSQDILALVQKYFEPIAPGPSIERNYAQEPFQQEQRRKTVSGPYPADALYMAFHSAARLDSAYYLDDLISDILSEGDASRLPQALIEEQALCTDIDAYITANENPGLFVIEARAAEGVGLEELEAAIWKELQGLCEEKIQERELQKLLNRVEHTLAFGETSSMNKALSLGYYEVLGILDRLNSEAEQYRSISPEDLQKRAQELFRKQGCSCLYYLCNGEEPLGGGDDDDDDDED